MRHIITAVLSRLELWNFGHLKTQTHTLMQHMILKNTDAYLVSNATQDKICVCPDISDYIQKFQDISDYVWTFLIDKCYFYLPEVRCFFDQLAVVMW